MGKLILTVILFLPALVAIGERGTFDSDGVDIAYNVVGEGESVVLIHGYMASGVLNWGFTGVTDLLSKEYKVIVMDVRGHGGSGKPEETDAYGVNMVEDVVRLLDHLDLKDAHVVGYSMGGMITLKMVAMYPDRMRSAVIGGMGWIQCSERESKPFASLQRSAPNEALSHCAASLTDLATTEEELRNIKIPITVIVGENDSVLPRRVAPIQKVRPDITVTIIPERDHKSCIFSPAFKKGIRGFIAAQAGVDEDSQQ